MTAASPSSALKGVEAIKGHAADAWVEDDSPTTRHPTTTPWVATADA